MTPLEIVYTCLLSWFIGIVTTLTVQFYLQRLQALRKMDEMSKRFNKELHDKYDDL